MDKQEYLEIEIGRLKARLKATSGYVLNTDMQLESNVLRAEINHLEYVKTGSCPNHMWRWEDNQTEVKTCATCGKKE